MVSESRWEILGKGIKSGHVTCKCLCGTVKELQKSDVKSGKSKSCGCGRYITPRPDGGICERGKYKSRKNGETSKEYALWGSMLNRCYSTKYQKDKPTYVGCTVSENFKYFQYFAGWCNDQIGFDQEGWQLDKDIVILGNKVYSEDSCVFVPRAINALLNRSSNSRGVHSIGTKYCKYSGYSAHISIDGKRKTLGYFDTQEEAFSSYKVAKELDIKSKAEHYKNQLDPRVYEALMKYEVHE